MKLRKIITLVEETRTEMGQTLPRPSRRALIRATRGLPGPERILAVARILGHLPDALRAAAYGAAPPPDDGRIERVALRSRRKRG